jgi:RNA polymerase sigma-70 factor (ECF subfamily)
MYKEEQELVQKILSGDRESFDFLYDAYFRKIYNYVYMQLQDHEVTEDLTQDIFIAFYESLERFEGKSSLLCWIFCITKNTIHNLYRKKSREICSLQSTENNTLENFCSEAATPLANIEYQQFLLACNNSLQQLAPESREVFYKRHFEGKSIKEISEETRKTHGSIKTDLYRTKAFLLKEVNKHNA